MKTTMIALLTMALLASIACAGNGDGSSEAATTAATAGGQDAGGGGGGTDDTGDTGDTGDAGATADGGAATDEDTTDAAGAADTAVADDGPSTGKQNLTDWTSDAMNLTAPDVFKARFETSKGVFVIEVTREWSPLGADRFFSLVKNGFYDDVRFFRVIENFMVQFGISGDPAVSTAMQGQSIKDDPVTQSNLRGYVTFAKTNAPNSRTSQVFINFGDNINLDDASFSPFGKIVEGMEVVDSLYAGYGEGAPRGRGPAQGIMQSRGNEYLVESFPKLDHVVNATVVE